ncbi:MAG TPA: DsbA family protein [Legionellales bacterium]|nr:DsbA family protein [Legionellales bacterium]
MKLKRLLTVSLLTSTVLSSSNLLAQGEADFSADQKKQIQTIMHDYLIAHPEVLIEASQVLQQKQQEMAQKQSQKAISEHADTLFTDTLTTVGNPKGDVTLVEFFDYQCIHCKKMAETLADMVKSHGNLRVIYKEFPIFGKSSEEASRAALAAAMQHKYLAMHDALLNQKGKLTSAIIQKVAQSIGLNMKKFKQDMHSQKVDDALKANRQLGENLHLMGTPACIIAATPDGKLKANSTPVFIPGAANRDTLNDLIAKAKS